MKQSKKINNLSTEEIREKLNSGIGGKYSEHLQKKLMVRINPSLKVPQVILRNKKTYVRVIGN